MNPPRTLPSRLCRQRTSRTRRRDWIGSLYARRLRVEALEDRRLLAAVTVTNNFDVVDGSVASIAALIALPGPDGISLREAIEAANANSDADEILFAAGLSGQTILLTQGELTIFQSLTIDAAPLAENVTIDAQQNSRVIAFSNPDEDSLTLAGLTIQNGRTTGDGDMGGGIRFDSGGSLTLSESILAGNSTTGSGADGGGIFARGPFAFNGVTLIGSTVSGNSTAGSGADGGGIFAYLGNVTLTDSTVSGNSTAESDADGGGIHAYQGRVTLLRSTLSGNSTLGSGANGGGIYSDFGPVTLTDSTVSGNSTLGLGASGGGIYSYFGAVRLTRSTVSRNSTAGTGARGGGIYVKETRVTLESSTLSGNSTSGANAHGGGIVMSYGSVTLNRSTVTGNSTGTAGANGGGIFVVGAMGNLPVALANSILAGNTVPAGSFGPDLVPDGDSMLTVNFSVIGTGIIPTAGDNNISTNAPLLGPLADNGGPTQTHALLPGSPAIDAGDPNSGGAVHIYELNGSLADELGGPALIAVSDGVLTATGYKFDPNQGLNLSGAIAADEYSIEVVFSFDVLDFYQKIIDFKDLAFNDNGVYTTGNDLDFFGAPGGGLVADLFAVATPATLLVTRDAATDVVVVYVDGIQVLSFVDSGDVAVFSGPGQRIRFFQDDPATGGGEAAAGFVDRIRIYNRDLSAAEVAALVFDQRGPGFARVVDGDNDGLARIDIGAFEAVPLVVNDAGDNDDGDIYNGVTTLREAINQANAIGGGDVITFDAEMSGHVILLGGAQLDITEAVTIDATALDENVIIDAQQQSRVMNFGATSGDLTLAGLTMRNGRTTGNADRGGGIRFASSGALTVSESTLSGNTTIGTNATGGAIYASSGVVLSNSTLSGNSTAGLNGYGGAIFSGAGGVVLTNSVVSQNSTMGANADGGAIFTSGDVTLTGSTLADNSATGSAADGGGIFAFRSVTLNQSTVSGNSAGAGGGGIFAIFDDVTVTNSTVSGNRTEGSGGGGIRASSGPVSILNSTVTGNSTAGTGAHGGGILVSESALDRPVTIRNSIVAGNTVAAGSTGPDLMPDPQSAVTVNFSLIGTGITPTAGGNNISTNAPLLGPLADNGGPTQTHALLPGSPAIDAADPNNDGAVHIYELNGSVADALGGPSLVVGGGFLMATGYQFGPNEGPQVSSAVTPDEYTIELVFSFDALGGYQKIIDTHDLADDSGLYSIGNSLHFYDGGTGAFAEDVLVANVLTHLVVTRDGPTDVVAVYVDGVQVITFVDSGDIAVFSGLSNVVRFFQDDNATGGSEAAAGFVDRIRLYDRDLSAAEVVALVFDQRGAGFPRDVDGDGNGLARMDIGAYEAQVKPSADFDANTQVDGNDFLAWQRGLGSPNATRAQGNSDGDGDVDLSDLAAWKSQYGATGVTTAAAAVIADDEPQQTAKNSAEARAAARDALFAAGDFTMLTADRPSFRVPGRMRLRAALR